MDKISELSTLLKRLNSGEDPEKVKTEAREFLSQVDARDLSIAEQNLLDEGLHPDDMQHLCSIHLEVLKEQVESLRSQLPPEHVVSTLVREHDSILCFLDALEAVNDAIQKMEHYDGDREEFRKLDHIADHLAAAELHHQREEDILFPEMENRGVYGPPMIMRQEHEQLRRHKQELKQLAEDAAKMDFNTFKAYVDRVVNYIVPTLREHIFKENNILYPAALKVIDDERVWETLKSECDKIGYCCFTPEHTQKG